LERSENAGTQPPDFAAAQSGLRLVRLLFDKVKKTKARRCAGGPRPERRRLAAVLVAFKLLTSVRGTLLFVSLERIVRRIEVVVSLKPAVRSFR
jgi:hypothetical protein